MTAMQVRRAGRWLGFAILTAALVHVATVWLLPQLTAKSSLDRAEEIAGFNQIIHLEPLTGAGKPLLPRPDPATLESVCAFDISGGAVRLTLPDRSPHLTVSVSANNAAPIYAASPAPEQQGLIIASEKQAPRLTGTIILSPGAKGIIRVRILAIDEAMRAQAEQARQQLGCGYAS